MIWKKQHTYYISIESININGRILPIGSKLESIDYKEGINHSTFHIVTPNDIGFDSSHYHWENVEQKGITRRNEILSANPDARFVSLDFSKLTKV